jgi:dTDP-4-amino-4,6-dideoxygalactose transaminase
MSDEAGYAVHDTLNSGFIGQGKVVDAFENRLSDFLQNPFVNTVNSATSGLHLALYMAKNNSGRDEVLTTPLTCVATNTPIVANGLKIKWVDVNRHDCNINIDDLRNKVTSKTLAIVVVHWGGYPVDLDAVDEIASECERLHGFRPVIIEDCAHAFGAVYKNQMIGRRNTCVFSFQAIKHLTTGDGGLITSSDKSSWERVKLLRWYGLDRTSSNDFRCEQDITEAGFKFHMNDISASIGLSNLSYVKQNLEKHRKNSSFYDHNLDLPDMQLLDLKPDRLSSCWVYTLMVGRRDNFINKMRSCGIQVSRVHDRNDKHTCFKEFKCHLPNLDYVCSSMICLPCGWWMNEEDMIYVTRCIQNGW